MDFFQDALSEWKTANMGGNLTIITFNYNEDNEETDDEEEGR